ncbi:MAG: beta-lactamase family protein [Rhodothermales bacterium]|nr:beta-lactamase family protein [Rhodothermales bacterium]
MKYVLLTLVSFITTALAGVAQPVSPDVIRSNVESYMDRLEGEGFSGGVLVAVDGEILLSNGYGFADRANQIPFSASTVFPIGSITKQFTGAAILKLEMMGNLDVTDLLSKYIDNIPDDKKSITLHHLLTHSAGLPDAIGFDFAEISRDEYIHQAIESDLSFEPGSDYAYSNVGYSILAALVEQLSGESYNAFVQEHLFKPARLNTSGYDLKQFASDQIAHGYEGDEDWGTFADKAWDDDGPYWHLRGNGGLLSTLTDMYAWHDALLGTSVLSDDAKNKYFYPHQPEGRGADSYYGYGWVIEESEHGKLIWHNGGNPYFSSDMRRYVDEDVMIFVISNSAEHKAFKIIPTISQIVFGEPREASFEKAILTVDQIDDHTAGKRTLAMLNMFSGNVPDLLEFVHENISPRILERFSAEDLVDAFKDDQRRIGKTEIHRVTATSEYELSLIVKLARNGEWRELIITVDESEPHLIVGIGVDEATEPGAGN